MKDDESVGGYRAMRKAIASVSLLLVAACSLTGEGPSQRTGSRADVPARTEPSAAEIRAEQTRAGSGRQGAMRDESLLDTYWKLVEVGGRPVVAQGQQREPHLILHRDGSRVSAHSGCNRLTGSYRLADEKLSFGSLSSTRMACNPAYRQEPAFSAALAACVRWRVQGQYLELFDEAGLRVARFEVRHL